MCERNSKNLKKKKNKGFPYKSRIKKVKIVEPNIKKEKIVD